MCIFTYGQTDSGKTHTMRGTTADPGVIARTLSGLFSNLAPAQKCFFALKMSYIEIYNDNVYDLLAEKMTNPLEIRQNQKGMFIEGLTETEVKSESEALACYETGEARRKFAYTSMNHQSSRSHVLVQLSITTKFATTSHHLKTYSSKLLMADLAGSECIEKSKTTGENKREGSSINRSLLSLATVVAQIVSNNRHPSFRDSKLTRILEPVLTENCNTIVICTVSPSAAHKRESLNTLRFGLCANKIKVGLKPAFFMDKPSTSQSNTTANNSQSCNSMDSDKYEETIFELNSKLVERESRINVLEQQVEYEKERYEELFQRFQLVSKELDDSTRLVESIKKDLRDQEELMETMTLNVAEEEKLKYQRIAFEMKMEFERQQSRLRHEFMEYIDSMSRSHNIERSLKKRVKDAISKNLDLERQVRVKESIAQSYKTELDSKVFQMDLKTSRPTRRLMHAESPRGASKSSTKNMDRFKTSPLMSMEMRRARGRDVVCPLPERELENERNQDCPGLKLTSSFRKRPDELTDKITSTPMKQFFN